MATPPTEKQERDTDRNEDDVSLAHDYSTLLTTSPLFNRMARQFMLVTNRISSVLKPPT
jgi:hypothetical protein